MKKLIGILLLTLSSCVIGDDTVYNYPGAVVVDKYTSNTSKTYYNHYVKLRIRNKTKIRDYIIETIIVPKFEYDRVELGDTIKIQ